MRGFRRRPRLRRHVPWLAAAAVLMFLAWRLAEGALTPLVGAVAEMEARAAALAVINRVTAEQVVAGVRYSDLISVQTDSQGNVTLLRTNTPEVNRLAGRAVALVQAELEGLRNRQFGIPLGDFMGSALLAHAGPRVPITFVPVGAVTAVVRHRFEAAGINQTRHAVLIELQAHVRVVLPLVVREVAVSADLPVAETIVAGQVPQQYWQGGAPPLAPGGR